MSSLKKVLKLPVYIGFIVAFSLIKNLIETDRITPSETDLISLAEFFDRFQEIAPEEDEFTCCAAEIHAKKMENSYNLNQNEMICINLN